MTNSESAYEANRPDDDGFPGEWTPEDDADYQAWLATWRVLPDEVPIEAPLDDLDLEETDDNPPW